jgi:glycosyl transferase family 25
MEVVVINLATRAARWNAMQQQLTAVGIAPVRIPAVAGATLGPEQRAALYSEELNRRQYHQPLCDGEIGCYASHLSVWQRLLLSGAECVAVLEDDIELDTSLPQVLAAIEALPGDWDLVKLIGRQVEKVEAAQPLCEGCSLVCYHRVPSLTSAYVLHRRGAAKLLAQRPPFGRPVDVDLRHWWECGLAVQGVQPYPVREAPSACESSIVGREVERDAARGWRRLWQQARYTWCNWQARQAAHRPGGEMALQPQAALRSHDRP